VTSILNNGYPSSRYLDLFDVGFCSVMLPAQPSVRKTTLLWLNIYSDGHICAPARHRNITLSLRRLFPEGTQLGVQGPFEGYSSRSFDRAQLC